MTNQSEIRYDNYQASAQGLADYTSYEMLRLAQEISRSARTNPDLFKLNKDYLLEASNYVQTTIELLNGSKNA